MNKLEIHIKEKDETLTILKTEKETLETNLNELRTTSSDSNAQIQADLKGKIEELQTTKETITNLKSELTTLKETNETLQNKSKEELVLLQESKQGLEQQFKQEIEQNKKVILELKESLNQANSNNDLLKNNR